VVIDPGANWPVGPNGDGQKPDADIVNAAADEAGRQGAAQARRRDTCVAADRVRQGQGRGHAELPLTEAGKAHAMIEASEHIGKVVLKG
jgi:hypothetical protein